jgi:hypothetical protein
VSDRDADGAHVLYRIAFAASHLRGARVQRSSERGHGPIDVAGGRAPRRHGEPDRRTALPDRAARPRLAVGLQREQGGGRRLVFVEAREHLVQDDVVQDNGARELANAVGKPGRGVAAALHERDEARPAERLDRRVDRDRACASRELGRVRDRLASFGLVDLDEVRRGRAHRAAVCGGIGAQRDAAVVRHVEPLVAVRRPRVGALDAGDQMAKPR